MRIIDLLRMSLSSLWKRKVRTILTVLGVVIGTISIVVMLSLGMGMKRSIMAEMESYGSMKEVQVTVNQWGSNDNGSSEPLRLDDELVNTFSQLEHVECVVPKLTTDVIIKYGNYILYTQLTGLSPEGLEYMHIDIGEGELPMSEGPLELFYGNSVPIFFYNESNYYYPYFDSGELLDVNLMTDNLTIYLDNDRYYTHGSQDENGNTIPKPKKHFYKTCGVAAGGPEDWSQYSDGIYCNIDALKSELKKEFKNRLIPGQPTNKKGKPYKDMFYSTISVYCDDMENVSAVQQTISDMGYDAYSQAEWIQQDMTTIGMIEVALGGIGAISLFVAAIGIINTMMMSIYERTKEIGIMKVIGCRLRDLQLLFLLEAGYIGFIGGTIGVIISYGISALINKIVMNIAAADFSMGISYIPLWLPFVAIIFGVLIGMLAGLFPSIRAMKLSPLAAMRN